MKFVKLPGAKWNILVLSGPDSLFTFELSRGIAVPETGYLYQGFHGT
jgi:hypothetical protein